MLKKKRRGRLWWWAVLVLVCVALIAFFLRKEAGREPNEASLTESPPPQAPSIIDGQLQVPIREEGSTAELSEGSAVSDVIPEENPCDRIERDVAEFFNYLDSREYIRRLELGGSTYDHFKQILRDLAEHPPIPAGEGVAPRIMAQNVYHFFRVLDREDLRLLRDVTRNEEDTMEINLAIFYRWLMLDKECPDADGERPSFDILYQYAGFFLNTIGGRAYLFRRAASLRLLVSYYSLLIVHEADKSGQNNYGIDIFPLIPLIAQEILHYPSFRFQAEYIGQLDILRDYYAKRR
jgi:hypothetical protein